MKLRQNADGTAVETFARFAGPSSSQARQNLLPLGHRPRRVRDFPVRRIGDKAFLGRCRHVHELVVFEVAGAIATGAAPHPLEVGHAVRCPRWRVGRELRLLRDPGLGHRQLRRVFRPKGLPVAGSGVSNEDPEPHRQRRGDGTNSMAPPDTSLSDTRRLSASRKRSSRVCPIPARGGTHGTDIPAVRCFVPDAGRAACSSSRAA